MKLKFVIFIAVAVLAFSLIYCGGSKTDTAAPSPAPAYSGAQDAPTTNAPAASAEDNEDDIDFKKEQFKEEMKDMRRVYLQNKNQ